MTIVGEAFVSLKPETEGFQQATESKLGGILSKLPGPIAAIGAIGVAVGGTLFAIGEKFEGSFNKIAVGTGKTGTELEDLNGSFKKVLSGTAGSFNDVSSAIVGLVQKTGLTGPPLEKLAKQYVDLGRITKTDVAGNIAAVEPLFNRFGIAAKDQGASLDVLFKASQASGVSITDLSGSLARTQPILGALGLSFDQQAALVAGFGKAGIRSQAVIMGLGKEFALLSKAGKDPIAGINTLVKSIQDAKTPTEALSIATAKLGARAGPELATAIRSGAFDIKALTATLTNGKGGIEDVAKSTETLGVKFSRFKNVALVALEPVAKIVLDFVSKGIDLVIAHVPDMEKVFQSFVGVVKPLLADISPILQTIVKAAQDLFVGFTEGSDTDATAIQQFGTTLRGVFDDIGPVIQSAVAIFKEDLPVAVDIAKDAFSRIVEVGRTVANFIAGHLKESLGALIGVLALLLVPLGAYVAGMVAAAAATVIAAAPFIAIAAAAAAIGFGLVYAYEHFKTFRDVVDTVVKFVKDNAVPFLTTAFNTIREVITTTIQIATDLWSAFGHDLLSIASTLIGLVIEYFRTAFNVFVDIVKIVTDLFTGNWSGAFHALLDIVHELGGLVIDAFKAAFNLIGPIMDGVVKVIKAIGPLILQFIEDLPGYLADAFSGLVDAFLTVGGDIVKGLVNGIKNAAPDVAGAIGDVAKGAVHSVTSFLGIGSPSKVFAGFGKNIIEGLVVGINGAADAPGNALRNLNLGAPELTAAVSSQVSGGGSFGGGASSGDVGSMLADIANYLKTKDPITVNQHITTSDPVLSARETVDQLRSAQFRAGR